jgi:hypothetical protein
MLKNEQIILNILHPSLLKIRHNAQAVGAPEKTHFRSANDSKF